MGEIPSEVWTFLGGLLGGGIAGSLLTLKFSKNQRVDGSGTTVDQSRSVAAGDIVGRDKK